MAAKTTKRDRALKLAIETLESFRRQRCASGNAAFVLQGIDLDFAVNAHKNYVRYTEAIEIIKDILEGKDNMVVKTPARRPRQAARERQGR